MEAVAHESEDALGGELFAYLAPEPRREEKEAPVSPATGAQDDAEARAEQLESVRQWLVQVYGERAVPAFEISGRTVQLLCQLRRSLDERRRQSALLSQQAVNVAAQFKSESKRLQRALDVCGLPIQKLQSATQSLVQDMATIGMALDVKNTRQATFLQGHVYLHSCVQELEDQVQSMSRLVEQRLSAIRDGLSELADARRQMMRLDEERVARLPKMTEQERDREYLQKKRQQYTNELQVLKTSIEKSGVTTSITHETLIKLQEDLDRILEDTASMEQRMKGFHNLPPDVSLAQVELQRARVSLQQLDDQLSREIHGLQFTT